MAVKTLITEALPQKAVRKCFQKLKQLQKTFIEKRRERHNILARIGTSWLIITHNLTIIGDIPVKKFIRVVIQKIFVITTRENMRGLQESKQWFCYWWTSNKCTRKTCWTARDMSISNKAGTTAVRINTISTSETNGSQAVSLRQRGVT